MNDKLNLLHELAEWLKPTTLAAVIADLETGVNGYMSHNMDMATGVFTDMLKNLIGEHDAAIMLSEATAEANGMAR